MFHRKPALPHKREGEEGEEVEDLHPDGNPISNSRGETDLEVRPSLLNTGPTVSPMQHQDSCSWKMRPTSLPSQAPPESSSQATPLMSRFMSSLINQIFQSPFNHQILEITVWPGSQEGQEGPHAQTRWRAPSSTARTPKSNHFHFPKVNHFNSKKEKKVKLVHESANQLVWSVTNYNLTKRVK